MANWQTFSIDLGPVDGLVGQIQDVSSAIQAVGQVAEGILQLLRVFTTPSLPNAISTATQLLIGVIEGVLANLEDTAAFGLFAVPTTFDDLINYRGGFSSFQSTVISSFYDTNDVDRPQIGTAGYLGGIVIYINSENPEDLLTQAFSLLRLFGQTIDFRYPGPINLRATPADSLGFGLGPLIEAFSSDPQQAESLLLEWEEPKTSQGIFFDLYAGNKFYIERSKNRNGTLLTRPSSRATQQDALAKRKAKDAQASGETSLQYREPVLDAHRQPIYLWEPLDPNDPFVDPLDAKEGVGSRGLSTDFLAGTYSKLLTNVQPGTDNAYYYRVRTVPSDTILEPQTITVTEGSKPEQITRYVLKLDGVEYTESEPSAPAYGLLPTALTAPPSFDLPSALLNLYRIAYLLRFDTDVFGTQSQPLAGSSTLNPEIPEYLLALDPPEIEFESGDIRAAFESQNPAGFAFTDDQAVRYFQGEFFPEAIPDYSDSILYVDTVGNVASSNALEQDPFAGARELFSGILELTPRERFRLFVDQVAIDKIERIVPLVMRNDSLLETIQTVYTANEALITTALGEFTTEFTLKQELALRNAVAQVFVLFEGQLRSGQPPNWESVRLFRDVLPDVDLIGQQLLDLITSISRAVGSIDLRFDATITGLQNRLAALDAIIEVLGGIITFLEAASSVTLDASILFVPPAQGGVPYFVEELVNATNSPSSASTDYGAGFVLAAGGAGPDDAAALFDALRFVFGL